MPDAVPMAQAPGYFHLHLISDATGETLITVARAAAAQYAKVMPIEHMHPLVRTQKQLDRALAEIEESPGIVLYTLLEENLVSRLEENAASLDCRSSRSLARSCTCSRPISAPNRPIRSAPSTRSMPNISAGSTRSTTR
jgi:hypothetical protein